MKRTTIYGLIITAALALASIVATAEDKKANVLLQAGIARETVQGDLKGAIEIYDKAVKEAGANRALAAQALMRMAECYQKLGDAEARKIYEQVVKNYEDQKEAAALARARLGAAATLNAGMTTRQVWTEQRGGPKVDSYGTVSPDGRFLSYTDWETGDLAIHDIVSGKDRHLTNKGSWSNSDLEYAQGSAISPDGKQVAFGWTISTVPAGKEAFAELRLIDLNGGKARVLFTNLSGANRDVASLYVNEWSPDGKWIAVKIGKRDSIAGIAVVSTDNGALRVLKSVAWHGSSKITFSPDSKYLAYDIPVNEDSEQREIHVIAVDGSRETSALARPANDRVLGWSPDGRRLVFASDRSGLTGIWSVPVVDGRQQGEPELIKANTNPGSMGMTRSGALYYAVAVSGRDVYVASADFETGKVLSAAGHHPETPSRLE
jgi:hypothetical protein